MSARFTALLNTRFTALSIYNVEFRDCDRSPEWKAGAMRGLQKALGEPCQTGSPYACGTTQDDAWRAGFYDGRTGGYMRDGFDAHVMNTKNARHPTPNAALLPCPFCGAAPVADVFDDEDTDGALYYVSCPNGDCQVSCTTGAKSREEADRQWNTRNGAAA